MLRAYRAGERDFRGVKLCSVYIGAACLSGIDLSCADLQGASMIGVNLSHANLHRANFSHTLLIHADLSNSNLSYAQFPYAFLTLANLQNCDLSEGNFKGANLIRANLSDVSGFIAELFQDAILMDAVLPKISPYASYRHISPGFNRSSWLASTSAQWMRMKG